MCMLLLLHCVPSTLRCCVYFRVAPLWDRPWARIARPAANSCQHTLFWPLCTPYVCWHFSISCPSSSPHHACRRWRPNRPQQPLPPLQIHCPPKVQCWPTWLRWVDLLDHHHYPVAASPPPAFASWWLGPVASVDQTSLRMILIKRFVHSANSYNMNK